MSLTMVAAASLVIAIDIGGTNLRFALIDEQGRFLARSRMLSSIGQGRESFLCRLLEGVSKMREHAAIRGESVVGIGVGVPGLVDGAGEIHASVNMRPLDGCNLSRFLQSRTSLPARCVNDANLIALGEFVHGAGRGMRSFVVITLGTGVGSGLILDGRLWSGVGGYAAEFGHVTVEPEGVPCRCGNRGCLEQYASARAIVRSAGKLSVDPLSDDLPDQLDAEQVARLARQGEAGALAAFEKAGRCLGIALASLTSTLNLEAAIICGGVAPSLDLMLPSLNRELRMRCFPEFFEGFSVVRGELGDDAGLLGAAATIREILPP